MARQKPTFVAEYETAWNNTTTPKTAMNAVAVSDGDKLVAIAVGEGDLANIGVTEDGAGTWSIVDSIDISGYCEVRVWTYTVTANENLTVSFTNSGSSLNFGGNVLRFSGSDGFGASNKENGADGGSGTEPSLSLTTTADNSAIVQIVGDWNAKSGTRTYRTVGSATFSELSQYADDATYAVHGGYYDDVGTAGAKTVGMSDPVSMKYGIIALEVKGTDVVIETQDAYPTTDTTRDNWEDEAGGTSNIYTHIDETSASDTDYIRTQTSPSSDVYVTKLTSLSTPEAGTQTFHLRYGKDSAGGDTISLLAQLRQGYTNEGSPGTLVDTILNNSNIGSGWTQADFTVTGTISNYADLYLRLVGNTEATTPANPSVRAVGARASGTTSVSFTGSGIPTNAEGDLAFIAIETSDSTTAAGTPADITDWTKVLADTTSGSGATGVTTLTVYGRFVPAGGLPDPTAVTGIANHGCGFMFSVKDHGCTALGDIVVGSVTDHGTSTSSVNIASITVTANSLIIGVHGLSDDAADTNNFSAGPTNANLASINKFADETVTTGAGGGIALWSATCAGTSTGTTAWTHDTAERAQSLHLGIKPLTSGARRAQVSWAQFQIPIGSGVETISANVGTATASGLSAGIALNITLPATLGTATASGLAASVQSIVTISCAVGSATASGLAANIALNSTIPTQIGTATASGLTASIALNETISCAIASATASGLAANLALNATISAALGTATASGLSASILATETIACALGIATASGLAANVTQSADQIVDCTLGAATASGLAVNVALNETVSCTTASATASGLSASIALNETVAVAVGSATASGLAASIESIGGIETVSCAVGTATAVGAVATVALNEVLPLSLGSATASGTKATIALNETIAAIVASATASGLDANIALNETIDAAIGIATASGFSALVGAGITITDSDLAFILAAVKADPQIMTLSRYLGIWQC